MNDRVKTKTVNLGRLPVYCGCYNEGVAYHKYNIVTYYGSSFINLVEGNSKYPVNIVKDSSSRLMSYEFKYIDGSWTGWMFVANSYDASIYATKAGDYAKLHGEEAKRLVEENFFTLDIEPESGDIWATYYLGGNIDDVYINDKYDTYEGDLDANGNFKEGDVGDIIMVYGNSLPKYILSYIVKLNNHTYEYGTFMVDAGDDLPEVDDPVIPGYSFIRWNGKPDKMPASDLTLEGIVQPFTTV